ncbi:MAG TPA: hypothetical protein DFI00_01705 [Rhodospirillaceae bacterium]|nr:hypothetical protein [Alphaproteobacteria bacterium]MAX95713.1 hypothetical protein [Alphaproteobacteria bacterium]HCI45988.1 hypothetical protein [Rhodospirillaceae bacterium]
MEKAMAEASRLVRAVAIMRAGRRAGRRGGAAGAEKIDAIDRVTIEKMTQWVMPEATISCGCNEF